MKKRHRVLLVILAVMFLACAWSMHERGITARPTGSNKAQAIQQSTIDDHAQIEVLHARLNEITAGSGALRAHNLVGEPAPANLPSKLVQVDNVDRGRYGGKQDKAHLGGFTTLDPDGISPQLWMHMMQNWTIKSVVDVGCGKGVSTSYFLAHGARVLCVEGSHDAVSQSLLPPSVVVEHDFSRGPWWPTDTFDAVWSVEFLEHVGTRYMHNYLPIFRKAALLFVSHSNWGGWHHVEVHPDSWWIRKMTMFGFVYSPELTQEARAQAKLGRKDILTQGTTVNATPTRANAQHLWLTLMVFINQPVSALPQHAHLFYADGCFKRRGTPNKPCEGDDSVPQAYRPLPFDRTKDQEWINALSASAVQT